MKQFRAFERVGAVKTSTLTAALALTLASVNASAAIKAGVEFPERLPVAGKVLTLNGLGVRKATILKIEVYVASLYLEAGAPGAKDGEQILGSPGLKHLEMRFVRDVGADKLQGAWDESLENNCSKDCSALRAPFDKLKALMADMKKGDVMTFTFYPDRVETSVKGQKAPTIAGAEFSRTLLSTWLGSNPPNGSLKEGLLGGG